MGRAFSTLLTTLLICSVMLPTATAAQTTGAVKTCFNPQVKAIGRSVANQISPFNLAHLAYQGDLKDRGIPSYGALADAISAGTVSAQILMQAAVKSNLLPDRILTDRGYRSALQSQLNELMTD